MPAPTHKEPRGRTVPISDERYAWWTNAVRRELGVRNWDQKDLAAEIGERPEPVSKCINRKVPTIDLLLAISDKLDIAYPVLLPESEHEAIELAKLRRLLKSELQLNQIKAGVVESPTESQSEPVTSENGVRKRKRSQKKGKSGIRMG